MKKMNSNILKVTYIFVIMFVMLGVYLLFYLFTYSEKDINNPYNKRQDLLEQKIVRGSIYADDMTIISQTVVDNDGLERRIYPYDELFCHVVGSYDKGKYGLEAFYNFDLLSTEASITDEVIAELNNEKLLGNSIVTTLNVELQNVCYEALEGYEGSIVIMNAETGDILSMVSNPCYNPNDIDAIWEDIRNEDKGVLLNRATQGLYPPGSVFKLFTLGKYIDTYKGTYHKYSYDCVGTVEFDDFTMNCSNKRAHGKVDLFSAFANSCNCAFVNMGSYIESDKFHEYCEQKLFNSELPLDLPYKESSFTLTRFDSEFVKSQTVIGQGETLVTPVHMCMVMSSIANDGVLMKPRLVTEIIAAKGNCIEKMDISEYATLYAKKEAWRMKDYLREVVNSGTAYRLKSDTADVYGKTGTAQINTTGKADSWFVGAIENDDNKYAFAIVLEGINENTSPAVVVAKELLNFLDK